VLVDNEEDDLIFINKRLPLDEKMKSKTTAYLLCIFLGLFGAHKFYLKKPGMGILYWLTAGLFFVGWIIDLFTLSRQVDQYNSKLPQSYAQEKATESHNDKTVFIEYEDIKGNFSDRTIEINRLYKKGDKLYINAYCFMQGEDRTFLVERILSMRKSRKEPEIKDIETYLYQLYKKPSSGPSAADLADLALEDD
jgi:TM2 domain-containing membrane protein YozV